MIEHDTLNIQAKPLIILVLQAGTQYSREIDPMFPPMCLPQIVPRKPEEIRDSQ
jgi:hypothetical protein